MTVQYLGEIRRVAFTFAPRGWALCNGQTLSIATNQALFSLLGTTYGGNGVTTFQLPDLRGRAPIHPSNAITQGQVAGAPTQTLTVNQIPVHTHLATASTGAPTSSNPQNGYTAQTDQPSYGTDTGGTMSATALASAGNTQPHSNESPYTVVNYIIAVTGQFPSRD